MPTSYERKSSIKSIQNDNLLFERHIMTGAGMKKLHSNCNYLSLIGLKASLTCETKRNQGLFGNLWPFLLGLYGGVPGCTRSTPPTCVFLIISNVPLYIIGLPSQRSCFCLLGPLADGFKVGPPPTGTAIGGGVEKRHVLTTGLLEQAAIKTNASTMEIEADGMIVDKALEGLYKNNYWWSLDYSISKRSINLTFLLHEVHFLCVRPNKTTRGALHRLALNLFSIVILNAIFLPSDVEVISFTTGWRLWDIIKVLILCRTVWKLPAASARECKTGVWWREVDSRCHH